MTPKLPTEKCPSCGRPAVMWWEKPAHGSRALCWISCNFDSKHLAGGGNEAAAVMNWNRMIARWRYFHPANKSWRVA